MESNTIMNTIFYLERIGVIVVAVLLLLIIKMQFGARQVSATLIFGDKTLTVLVADTTLSRMRGLGGRDSLAPYDGMFFFFDSPAKYGIWMKDMLFPIDIVWLAKDPEPNSMVVVDLAEDVAPKTYPKIFSPTHNASFVLELPAGFAREQEIKIGSRIFLKK